jgi:hypothetical protein
VPFDNLGCCHAAGNDLSWRDQNWRKKPVLVHVGEFAEVPERMESPPEGTVVAEGMVRLTCLDECLIISAQLGYPRISVLGTLGGQSLGKRLNGVIDGKLDAFLVDDVAVGIFQRELKHQEIQTGSKVVDDIADDRATTDQELGQVRHLVDVDDVLAGLTVELYSETWAITLDRERLRGISVENISVSLSPLYLCPTAVEGCIHET